VRGDRDRLLDMLEMCDLLIEHVSSQSRLSDDPVIQAAAQRWIEVLGEAASRVSEEIKRGHPEVAWREILGLRVMLARGYFHIDQNIVGSVIERDVPELRVQLQVIADSLASSEGDSPA
jgi:uncharacterized protein with HEPN domain